MRKICLLVLILISMISCNEQEIKLPDYSSKLVVEGFIEQDQFPIIYLTRSNGFYEPVDSTSLQKLVVTTARVAISDGNQEEVLTLFRDDSIFPSFYYSGTDLRGVIGRKYDLSVIIEGETYFSSTTITPPALFDSLWFESIGENDSLGSVFGKFTDNGTERNFYRVFSRIESNSLEFRPTYQSVAGDEFFDGKSFTFAILQGTGSLGTINPEIYFNRGDTVDLKFCTMDRDHFDFWRTIEREQYSTGNPFASAGNNIVSNIHGDKEALGVWGGYGASYYRFIIP